jgi:ankyrin repeat protein
MIDQEKLNDRLLEAVKTGDLTALSQALNDGANAAANDSMALMRAASYGDAQCVKLLIPASNPLANGSQALVNAAVQGHAECVKLLIPVSDPMASESYALQRAAHWGHAECVKLLIPVSDPLADYSLALRWAAQEGHVECVRLLLPVSDPLAMDEDELDAATCAREGDHMEVARMIETFIEAGALSDCAQQAKKKPRAKSAL